MAFRLRIWRLLKIAIRLTKGHRVSVCQGFTSLSTAAEEEYEECDISGLLEMLKNVPDRRGARGRIYPLSFVLGVSLVATLAGVSNFGKIRDHGAARWPALLRMFGGVSCEFW